MGVSRKRAVRQCAFRYVQPVFEKPQKGAGAGDSLSLGTIINAADVSS